MNPVEYRLREQMIGMLNLVKDQMTEHTRQLARQNDLLNALNFRLEHLVVLGILAQDEPDDILSRLAHYSEKLYDR